MSASNGAMPRRSGSIRKNRTSTTQALALHRIANGIVESTLPRQSTVLLITLPDSEQLVAFESMKCDLKIKIWLST